MPISKNIGLIGRIVRWNACAADHCFFGNRFVDEAAAE